MSQHRTITISSDLADVRRVVDEIETALQKMKYGERDIFSIRLGLEENFIRVIKDDNEMDPEKRVFVRYEVTPDRFDVRITGEGSGFNPSDDS